MYDPVTADTIVAGTSAGEFALAAYKSDGTLDTAFGPDGTGLVTFAIGSDALASAAAVDASGRILVAGSALVGTNYDFAVARFTPNGAPDTTFAGVGDVTQNITATNADFARAIAIQSNGRILLAGSTQLSPDDNSPHYAFAAFTPAGNLDSSFGMGGVIFADSGPADQVNALAVGASDEIIAAGETAVGNGTTHAELLTLTADGGNLAQHTVNLSETGTGSGDLATAVAYASNEYLIAGSADGKFVLAKTDSSGNLDTSFNSLGSTPGEVETAIGTSCQVAALAVQPDGRIIVAGSAVDNNGHMLFAVARYRPSGTLDTSAFGAPNGYVTTDFTDGMDSNTAAGAVLEPDGKLIVAGTTNIVGDAPGDFAVARYITNNAPLIAGTSGSFTPIEMNETSNSNLGETVASLIAQLSPVDSDGNTLAQFGLAVTAVDNSNGTWQYSSDSGSTWSPIPSVNDAQALLLDQTVAAGTNQIRFVPGPNYTGPSNITVRAWDETQGTSGSSDNVTADLANNLNAYSDSAAILSIEVVRPAVVYVNAAWAGSNLGQTVNDSFGPHTFGIDAAATIQDGVNLVASGGTVDVDAGSYPENVTMSQSVSLVGPNAMIDPVGQPNLRVAEAIVDPASGPALQVTASGGSATIEGLSIVADVGVQLSAGAAVVAEDNLVTGNDPGSSLGIDFGGASAATISQNAVSNVAAGIVGCRGPIAGSVTITGNSVVANPGNPPGDNAIAVAQVAGSVTVTGNTVDGGAEGIAVGSTEGPVTIQGNTISEANVGLSIDSANDVQIGGLGPGQANSITLGPARDLMWGIIVRGNAGLTNIQGNYVEALAEGLLVETAPGGLVVQANSINVFNRGNDTRRRDQRHRRGNRAGPRPDH